MGVDVVGDDVVGDDRGVTRASLARGAAALAIAVATAALLLATEPRLAIVWDEGYTLGREARLRLVVSGAGRPAAVRGRLASPRR